MRFLISLCVSLLLINGEITTGQTTVGFQSIINDPCFNYESLDRPWRANNESADIICDNSFSWNGWYRLFYNGMDIRMPETCVGSFSCNTQINLWLNGPHPQIEDGVVIREVCGGTYWGSCCDYKTRPIRVKACPGNYYVYELVKPEFGCAGYCTDVSTISQAVSIVSPDIFTGSKITLNYDACNNYNILDNYWRSPPILWYTDANRHDDTLVEWDGWYRLFINGSSAQMPEWCMTYMSCGGYSSLWLGGSHPRLEDGVVTREIYGSRDDQCSRYRSNPIQVKACPGNYYVYKFTRPALSIPAPVYCAELFITPSVDPCHNYTLLNDPWRATDHYNLGMCDYNVDWKGWYRLFYNGLNAQMPESCVNQSMCGTYHPLWLNGSHPQLEDGVVTRQVCVTSWNGCCAYKSHAIRVKSCPGNYYVYEFVKPIFCGAYCLESTSPSIPPVSTTTEKVVPTESITSPIPTAVGFQSIIRDPCFNYESLDRPWRANNESGDIICDNSFSWNGWYRLFYNGMDIRMPETCVGSFSCNTQINLWLNGPHPQIEDGVVIREVCGSYHWGGCCDYKTRPIRVKACPGNYYVYELVKPEFGCAGYCTDVSTISQAVSIVSPDIFTGSKITLNYDACNNYNILDNYWRSPPILWYTDANRHDDTLVEWDGWYRLFINGSSAQMPEWCVTYMSCGGYSSLWLGGSHPRLEDGVVTREIYGSRDDQCSRYRSNPIQVKACPGNYYVYKFTRPALSIPAPVYCAELFITPSVDPCHNYTLLNDPWRATDHYNLGMCDYNVDWKGWYRLFYNGLNAQMPESCVNQSMCGTYHPLWLNGSHPQLEDGVVTRQVCVSSWNGCCAYKSHAIRVKSCPGNYYVYEFVKPIFCGAYCLESTSPSIPPVSTTTEKVVPTESITSPIPTADVRDLCSELSCSEDEWCGMKNGVYGCLCKKNRPQPHSDSFDFSETCESSSGSMSVSRCQLFEAGFPADVLHLNDPRCKGTVRNGRVEFNFNNDEHICGTNLVANGTHFIYDNFNLRTPRSEKSMKLSVSCVYPQTQTFFMNVENNPLESIVHRTLPAGEDRYRVRMIPYQDEEFIRPFTGRVDAELDQEMHVEVRVEGVDSRQFALVMDTCWATPENDPDYSLRWDLIRSECPNPDDDIVNLMQNGVSTSSRFSFGMKIDTAKSTKLYLHCVVHLCLVSSNRCSTDCASGHQRREGRSLDFHDSASISMGPLVWSGGNTDKMVPDGYYVSEASCLCASLMLFLVPLMSVLAHF
ncbi:uncharacterized protein [Pseudorasbora parva]|uniref:uncharacterized protein n=1 Tax=Pseudorasbora parva TaxID=51549 RepID=UPI00351EC32A